MKHFDLDSNSQMSNTVGLLHAMVVQNFERLKKGVQGLSQDTIDYKGQNGEYNSIAQLLRHLAVVDLHWVYRLQGEEYPVEMLQRFGPMYDEQGRLPAVHGISLETLLSEYEDIQSEFKKVCMQITEDQIHDIVPFGSDKTATVKWGIWHVADHSRHHYADIVHMKKLYKAQQHNDLDSVKKQFLYYKTLGEKAIDQLEEEQLFFTGNEDTNSIATIVKHLRGHMLSRWTDFLTTDGEKPWRDRDSEFENDIHTKEELLQQWNEGWDCLFTALHSITLEQLTQVIYIRKEGLSVIEAIHRQLAHYPYHIGQIVYAAKWLKNSSWNSLSIPKKQ